MLYFLFNLRAPDDTAADITHARRQASVAPVQLRPAAAPAPRTAHTLTLFECDATLESRRRLHFIVYGGFSISESRSLGDVHVLELSYDDTDATTCRAATIRLRWVVPSVTGVHPPPRFYHTTTALSSPA